MSATHDCCDKILFVFFALTVGVHPFPSDTISSSILLLRSNRSTSMLAIPSVVVLVHKKNYLLSNRFESVIKI